MKTPLTPQYRQFVQWVQKQAIDALEAKTVWTNEDFEDRYNASLHWLPEAKFQEDEMHISLTDVEKLAFDARTPKHFAEKLQQMLIEAKKAGALSSNS
ncbi:hypothetical protein QNI16_14710 [Cytophagaceae bacterium YF14B1]|uniref:Uncharacterized protein n=1 Tax=Xanthocytophaga flava TaxID=3048013 RepID=A0AAE3QRZ0_9BACT|nr:hypothetical protein [Xanthocytophaga flavus]MDJ1481749.1 hypothetical protein [Xanthocytophaga flavus]